MFSEKKNEYYYYYYYAPKKLGNNILCRARARANSFIARNLFSSPERTMRRITRIRHVLFKRNNGKRAILRIALYFTL